MISRKLKTAIKRYDDGYLTANGVYESCETDLEFYRFLKYHVGMEEDEIMDTMDRDAYNNALALANIESLLAK